MEPPPPSPLLAFLIVMSRHLHAPLFMPISMIHI